MYDGTNVTGQIEFQPDGKLSGLGKSGTWKVRDSKEILIKLGKQEQVLEFDDTGREAVVIDPPTIPMSRLTLRKDWNVQKDEDKAKTGFGGESLDPVTQEQVERENQERLCIDIIGWNNYYQRLGVTQDIPQDQIEKAFEKRQKQLNTTRNIKNWKLVLGAKKDLSDAFQTLNDHKQRKLYDAFLVEFED